MGKSYTSTDKAGERPTGFQVIHANRLEDLRSLTVEVIRHFPLAPLDDEVFLVHSNGIAQWLKLALARDQDDPELAGVGIAAGMTFSLPSRFLWQVYRAVLGEQAVAKQSPYDKDRLTWRLLRLLPEIKDQPVFAPLARFLAGAEGDRRLYQLADRIADLFDQYQVYRADWLDAWRQGRDEIKTRSSRVVALAGDQCWQPALWRLLNDDIGPQQSDASRADVHNHFMTASASLSPQTRPQGLPKRLIVFGVSSLPQQTLEVLSRLGRCSQVLLCVHNPCRYYWADIVEDRELLRATNRRGRQRESMPDVLDENNLHLHANPLLAAWGKQGRDYIRLLDEYDDQAGYAEWFDRIDIFESHIHDPSAPTLLAAVQDDILELRPTLESVQWQSPDYRGDESLVFHTAHSPQREIEILHDQLLAAFSADDSLKPQDVIVMVPDINAYAPHIQAVFGQLEHGDDRYLPFTISDQGQRHQAPVLVALDMLLGLPDSRLAVSDVLDLLDVPAVRDRFGLQTDDLPQLHEWIQGANIRWGLNAEQKQTLELPGGMSQNTWLFGLRRMLLGYVVGENEAWQGIEPYSEVGGLESRLAGQLEVLVRALEHHWHVLSEDKTPDQWSQALHDLKHQFLGELDSSGELVVSRLDQVVDEWGAACHDAGLADTRLPLTIVRDVWLDQLDQGGLSQRFLAGKVNFATLMPMRAIPFKQICLLGMNDGDYPRSQPPMDFDLMARDIRPGDRSRREDDRYLFLEALLSARKQFYISWIGRSIKDNSERPPSVLVAQLRDYINAVRPITEAQADDQLSHRLTTEHPLQPFSPRYFDRENDQRLFTYAREWREAHQINAKALDQTALTDWPEGLFDEPVTLAMLGQFLRSPVDTFFQSRLGVYFDRADLSTEDNEPFVLDGLENWKLSDELIRRIIAQPGAVEDLDQRLDDHIRHQSARGELAQGGLGQLQQRRLKKDLPALSERYQSLLSAYPVAMDLQLVSLEASVGDQRLQLEDWLGNLRANAAGDQALVFLHSSGLTTAKNQYKWVQFLRPWVHHLAANALSDQPITTHVLSKAGDIAFHPYGQADARQHLTDILMAWLESHKTPLPLAPKAAFAWLDSVVKQGEEKAAEKARSAYEGGYNLTGEVADSPALQRCYPEFESLRRDGEFTRWLALLYRPIWRNVKQDGGTPT
ncbi:exodeoxyribonuclease V subunit gamma [Marinobacter caseinilyticus]|uniref:exodeoxyribonuclease V subunit gamma n=1 Tax=Marinobacter caseinilyticus TaxID=2692195 RepID=UPI00140741A6|nr:exodeoxyribonuclease V subunit gamma [Marinobacter caseinilyticus]